MYDRETALEYAKLVIPVAAALVGASARWLGKPSGPQGDLTRLQRIFLWFPPATPRAYAAHGLAWGSLFGGLISILLLKSSGSKAPDAYADLIVLTLFLSLTFRGWALAERRWNDPKAIPNVLPILRKPANWRMLTAQISLWSCLFCALESLEDLCYDAINATNGIMPINALGRFLISLWGAGVCGAWALAESKYGGPESGGFATVFFQGSSAKRWSTSITGLLGMSLAVAFWLLNSSFRHNAAIDRIELNLVWVSFAVASIRLVNLLLPLRSMRTRSDNRDGPRSAAA